MLDSNNQTKYKKLSFKIRFKFESSIPIVDLMRLKVTAATHPAETISSSIYFLLARQNEIYFDSSVFAHVILNSDRSTTIRVQHKLQQTVAYAAGLDKNRPMHMCVTAH